MSLELEFVTGISHFVSRFFHEDLFQTSEIREDQSGRSENMVGSIAGEHPKHQEAKLVEHGELALNHGLGQDNHGGPKLHDGDSEYDATDDESEYLDCRSGRFSTRSSTSSWLQSPEHTSIYQYSTCSGDVFVDALDEYLDAESDGERSIVNFSRVNLEATIEATGRPDLCGDDPPDNEDKHPLVNPGNDGTTVVTPESVVSPGDDGETLNNGNDDHPTSNDDHPTLNNGNDDHPTSNPRTTVDVENTVEPQGVMDQVQPDGSVSFEASEVASPSTEVSGPSTGHRAEVLPGPSTVHRTEVPSTDPERKKCIMRLGSKETEKLLQLDVAELVRPSSELDRIAWSTEYLGPDELCRYVEEPQVRETYMDTVYEMEDILLDTEDSLWAGRRPLQPSSSSTVYDGLWKVDSVQVIGARQRRGGASLGERVVGIREHTIYRIRVKSGHHEWEIERRYREFVELHQQLKWMFNSSHSRIGLPTPWDKVAVESRKLFGNTSPDVVEYRSALLQVCLQSALQAGIPIATAAPLLRFLFPSPSESRIDELRAQPSPSPRQLTELGLPRSAPSRSPEREPDRSPFGTTIRLIVQLQTTKPFRQQLLNQRNLCAGCYELLSPSSSVVSGFVKTLGWGRPRLCEYTGQLFCSACHLNEKAIIPARVLQGWDFTPGNVSQLAKAYLDSIYDQPMLCVSAVNPLLYSRVPILAHVNDMRGKLSKLAACIRCPARGRVQQMLGSRRYLMEHNDFYALRDLTDLSKGAFAVLPGLLKASVNKLVLHVRQKCSVCLELGEPCGAGVCCERPAVLIYPYEDEVSHRCQLCGSLYHKTCFGIIETCRACTQDSFRDSTAAKRSNYQSLGLMNDRTPSLSSNGSSNDLAGAAGISEEDITNPKMKIFSSILTPSRKKKGSSKVLNMSAFLGSPAL